MNREQFAKTANERYQRARTFWRNWRVCAVDDYAFVAGDQWLQEDKAKLEAERRPPITFNYSEKMVDAVVGAEVGARQETHFSGRGVEDAPLAEVWNAAAKYFREQCDAEDEETDAFRDALICGIGWTQTRMSYEDDLDGELEIERIDPLEMYPDPAATKSGLKDRRWQDRVYWADEADVRSQFPRAFDLSATEDTDRAAGVVRTGHGYQDEDSADDNIDRRKGQVQIRLHETFEYEQVYRVASGDQMVELSEADFNKLNKEMAAAGTPIPANTFVKQRKRVYYRAFFNGETLLDVKKSPCQQGFCFQAITCKRDRNRNTWYGLTRVMKDPQRWANKWLSQILYIINSNAKGGLLAEVNAFVDIVKAQDEWADPASITLLQEGAMSGNKIKQKEPAQYPAGLDKLMEFALGSLPMVTGINLEALGLANREQAGVLEQQRKQAAYGLLAPMFDALRHYRKNQGRVLLYYIVHHMSDGRLIRIGGPESQEFVPLTKAPGAIKYDITVDQSPTAPDTKQKTWETLENLIPAMLKAGIPVPPDLLDYTPLPVSLQVKWKQFIGQQQQINQEVQQENEKLKEQINALKSDQAIKQQELEAEQAHIAAKIQMEREAHEQKMELERIKAKAEFDLEAFKQDRQFELEQRRLDHEKKMKQQQVDNEFKVKAFAAGVAENSEGDDKERKVSIGIDTSGFGQIMQSLVQTQQEQAQLMSHAMQTLSKAMSSPRKLITDATGKPIGSELVQQE
jgi:hypothetical protein